MSFFHPIRAPLEKKAAFSSYLCEECHKCGRNAWGVINRVIRNNLSSVVSGRGGGGGQYCKFAQKTLFVLLCLIEL